MNIQIKYTIPDEENCFQCRYVYYIIGSFDSFCKLFGNVRLRETPPDIDGNFIIHPCPECKTARRKAIYE